MDIKKLTPHLIAIGILLAVAAIFFAPNAFNGKVLPQPDNDKARGMQTEIRQFMDQDGKAPLWTNSAFGGMPAYQIYAPTDGNYTRFFQKALFFGADYTTAWVQLFVAMLCMYFLMCVLGANWRAALFGAVAFGITTYNVDILEAGHSTKMIALAMSPAIFASVIMTFNGRLLIGTSLTAMLFAMQIYANHIQITYYTMLLVGIYVITQLIDSFRHKNFIPWGKATLFCGMAIALGFSSNMGRMWSTYEYGQETIRGKSDLSKRAGKGDGLDKDYMFGWSSGIAESLTLMVPHAYGGGAGESIKGTEFYNIVSKGTTASQKNDIARQTASYYYWGDQPFVGTAIYFGAIVCFLFFMGLVLVPGQAKWWLASSGIFMLSLAWGKHFFLNDVLYSVLPMFNKFRAVTMALGISQLCVAALGALALQKFFDADIDLAHKKRALYVGVGITSVLCLLAAFMGGGAGPNDAAIAKQMNAPQVLSVLMDDRAALARSDAFRSLGFILAAAAILWIAMMGRIKAAVAVLAIGGLALADHWLVCTRTITADKFENKKSSIAKPQEKEYDKQIKQDKDPHYRVLDLSRGSITGNATTSYFHKSLSGYHAAKLQRFQEVVDTFLSASLSDNLHIIGMMNGKYIVTQKGDVIPNPKAYGNAWFVKHYDVVPTADAAFQALGSLNPRDSAVVATADAGSLQGLALRADSSATIRLSKYHPDKMEYEYSANSEQLAIFSEMYYPPAKGWKCYLNGQPAPDFFKVNYLLRGMRLPAGQNQKLEMRFEPESFLVGGKISFFASIMTILLFFAGLFLWYQQGGKGNSNVLTDFASEEKKPVKASVPSSAPTKKGKK